METKPSANLPPQFVIRFNISDLTLNIQDFLFQEPKPSSHSQEVVLPSSVNAVISAIWGTISALSNKYFKQSPQDSRVPDIKEMTSEFARLARPYLESYPLTLSKEGIGGTYFLQDPNGANFAVFKPIDEEPGAPNNPKKLVTDPLLPPGGGAAREVAAFYLDRGFAGVPQTHLLRDVATASHGTKSGSIQQYINNDGESSSIGSSSFLVDDVHRIGTLDIRLFNMDRNGENMLVKNEGAHHRLVPIDHTYILPESLDSAYFEWMYWPHSKQLFSQETLEFIRSIDIEFDALVLRSLGISEASIRTMKISTMLLKHFASQGKSLFEIASYMCRDFSRAPSKLEELVARADQQSQTNFYDALGALLKEC